MATLQEDIYNVKHVGSKGNPGGDFNLKDDLVKHWLIYYRDLVLQKMAMQNQEPTLEHFQRLGCLELQEVDYSECPCFDISWECQVKKVEIPMPITFDNYFMLWVGLTDRLQGIPVIYPDLVRNQMYARFTGKVVATLEPLGNGKANLFVYAKSDQLEELVYIYSRGVFADPSTVNTSTLVNNQCTTVCFDPLTDRFPMSGAVRAQVYAMIFQQELKLTLSSVEDIIANSQDDDTLMKIKHTMNMIDLYGARAEQGNQRGRPPSRSQLPSPSN